MSPPVRVATRRSPLALAQAREAVAHLQAACPGQTFLLETYSTQGDERLEWSLEKEGGKGLFTSELERALACGEADLAVHSAKDLPTELPEGLALAGFLPRAPADDLLLLRADTARVTSLATGSPRRRMQLQEWFPEATWREIRGNVGTRLDKIRNGYADGTVMAHAGIHRLGLLPLEGIAVHRLDPLRCVPAAGQGAIALECRAEDAAMWTPFLCAATALAVNLERTALSALGGGCHSASAAHFRAGQLYLFTEGRGKARFSIAPSSPEAMASAVRQTVQSFLS
ncbi:MAG: hydroxymethylbilane synthase [Opitutales bacterium]|nr:hydroxymethylbilane synthase [Opitutales bacterium]